MRLSQIFVKTLKNPPKEAKSASHKFLVQAGFVDQLMAGVYTFLPLGLIVLKKIENITREEMLAVGGQEILMPALHPKDNWEKTDRWENMDTLFRFTSFYSKNEFALGPTHEEVLVPLVKHFIFSYKDLPKYIFQIQDKFRDEKRPKSGILRGREFSMKDLYSFHADEKDLDSYYEKMKKVYANIFNRVGIGEKTYITFASGGSFSKYSHEFQTESKTGEDTIYLCGKCRIAVNKEIINEQKVCPDCKKKNFKELKGIEVGNIFKLKTRFTKPFGLTYVSKDGKEKLVTMGCYGIGLSRLMGAIVEVNSDLKGIIWPKTVAPFAIHLVTLDDTENQGEKIYQDLTKLGFEVLWDDRKERAGVKFADADLIGIPLRVVMSKKTLKRNQIELKPREKERLELIEIKNLKRKLKNFL